MATTCPIGFDASGLRTEVAKMYADLARNPDGDFHFHRGPAYAASRLGYDLPTLELLPSASTSIFAGVGNPLAVGPLRPGQTVVDVGCGGGMDLLLAAQQVGPTGTAIGVDMTPAMQTRARAAAADAGLSHVEVRAGDAQDLPIEDASADVVISNGVVNLTTDKLEALQEVFRVLRPGGRLQLADIVVSDELPEGVRNDIDLWASWIGGALPEAELVSTLESIGFHDVRVTHRYLPFEGTTKEAVTKKFGVIGISLHALKPNP